MPRDHLTSLARAAAIAERDGAVVINAELATWAVAEIVRLREAAEWRKDAAHTSRPGARRYRRSCPVCGRTDPPHGTHGRA